MILITGSLAAAGIDELQFPLIGGNQRLLQRILWRRLESSEAALLESIRRQTRFYERALDCLRSGRTLSKREQCPQPLVLGVQALHLA